MTNNQPDFSEQSRVEADRKLSETFPLLLAFLGDKNSDVPLSVSHYVSDLLRLVSKRNDSELTSS